jgi:multidrug resistance efflux pump
MLLLIMSGCEALPGDDVASQSEETIPPVVVQDTEGHIYVEGIVEPERSITLRANQTVQVVDVPIKEQDVVEAGDVLVRFDDTKVQLAIQQAGAALQLARAQLALAQAGARQEEIAVIEGNLAAAEAAVAQAIAYRDQVAAEWSPDLADAQASLAEADVTYQRANEAHDDTMECFSVTGPDGSTREVCPMLGTYEEITRYQMQAALTALEAARLQIAALQESSEATLNAAKADVQVAIAQRDAVQAELELARAGGRAEAIKVAEVGVKQAEAALLKTQSLLDSSVLEAPFQGTITDLDVEAGDTTATGARLLTLATVDRLWIRTKDLTELDVVHVTVGQGVIVTMDALPDQPLAGHIVRVDPQADNYLGDVTYAAFITLDEGIPAWLRWGMTAQIEIEGE